MWGVIFVEFIIILSLSGTLLVAMTLMIILYKKIKMRGQVSVKDTNLSISDVSISAAKSSVALEP